MDKAASAFASPNGPAAAASGKLAAAATDAAAAAAATAAVQGSMDIDSVSKALDWWEKRVVGVDEELHRLGIEGKRFAYVCTYMYSIRIFSVLYCIVPHGIH